MKECIPSNKKEESATYSRDQVLEIISKLHATTTDYLILTYFKIYKITNGSLYEKYRRRLSHLIFNCSEEITEELTMTVFAQKSQEILIENLSATTFVSCICPFNLTTEPCPIFIQYFNPNSGIEHRLLGYTPSPLGLSTLLIQHDVIEKLIGYCGDFLYNDPGIINCKSDHFSSLCQLSGNTMKYLPYSDGFIARLFDVLIGYLPENLAEFLSRLGETFLRMSSKSQFAENFVKEYKNWLLCNRRHHILLTSYTEFVIENLDKIKSYLEPSQCLFRSIEAVLCNVFQRCLLIFMRDLYLKVDEIKLSDNCAVMYYFQLVQIRDLFKSYEDSHYIPPRTIECFNKEIDFLVENHVLDQIKDKSEIDDLFKEIVSITRTCFTRAIKYINPLLNQFANFDNFSWILLRGSSVDENQIHQTYHLIKNTNCADCPSLFQEVKELNSVLARMPLLEMNGTIVSKWVAILKNCPKIPNLVKLLEYLLALPASCDVMRDSESSCDYSRTRAMIRFNLTVPGEEVVNNIENFFEGHVIRAKSIIKNNQIPLLID
ncbi:hypothetical protein BDFB_010961 [Asbolus verrucosus]|uniref:Uncharacterized protein n=1 Tax=Asbolus verrucosus TaxID=1661398 RepID=A0A482W7A4_ASBVE|nr:hypothetical protein BDFB_010961 [Asbolus verrucosus]